MKVRLLTKSTLDKYVSLNTQSQAAFNIWLKTLRNADWDTPADIISSYSSSDILGEGSKRVVFNIGGNKYRLICKY